MKNKVITNLLLLSLSCTIFFCNSSVKSSDENDNPVQDSLKRPASVSNQATLINLGSEDLPVYQWVEYSGKLNYDNKVYPHIYGFKYFDAQGKLIHTQYYENMEVRSGEKEFDASSSKILPFPGDATIQVSNSKDSLLFFYVLESDEFKSEYEGVDFIRMPAVYFETRYDNGFMSDEQVRFNLRTEKNLYIVTFLSDDVFKIPFKLCSTCKVKPTKISFLNEEEGRIYFIEKDCYLEPVNSEDIQKIQALRR